MAVNFFLAYRCLLEAMAENDRDTLFDICEGNLYHKLSDSLDLVKERGLKLKLRNTENHKIQMDTFHGSQSVIDYQNFAGARISRKANRENGIKEASAFLLNLPNVTFYMPSNPFKISSFFGDKKTDGSYEMKSVTLEL